MWGFISLSNQQVIIPNILSDYHPALWVLRDMEGLHKAAGRVGIVLLGGWRGVGGGRTQRKVSVDSGSGLCPDQYSTNQQSWAYILAQCLPVEHLAAPVLELCDTWYSAGKTICASWSLPSTETKGIHTKLSHLVVGTTTFAFLCSLNTALTPLVLNPQWTLNLPNPITPSHTNKTILRIFPAVFLAVLNGCWFMYVIILEHPSCVTGNDVHTRVHLFRAFILQILVHTVHLFIYFCRKQVCVSKPLHWEKNILLSCELPCWQPLKKSIFLLW